MRGGVAEGWVQGEHEHEYMYDGTCDGSKICCTLYVVWHMQTDNHNNTIIPHHFICVYVVVCTAVCSNLHVTLHTLLLAVCYVVT